MFVQIIEGTTTDPEGLARMSETWDHDLRPGAAGFLGVTSGVTADNKAITIVRFEDEASARANERRPEQTAFAEEMSKYFSAEPTFIDSTDIETYLGGGSNDAGFVQVMKMSGINREAAAKMDAMFEKYREMRPDVIGGIRVWSGPESCHEVIYFTSEAEARDKEKQEPPAEMQAAMAEFGDVMAKTTYLDLSNPIIK